jgi:hypothetical protein
MKRLGRQGELLIMRVKKTEDLKLKKLDHRILAEGETTGHKHELTTGILFDNDTWRGKGRFINIAQGKKALLEHPEHKTIEIEPGFYQVITQREYTEQGARRVRD